MPKVTRQGMKAKPRVKDKTSVLDRIAPIGFDDDEGIKMLLYGRSGTGKSTYCGTLKKPALAIICSGTSKPGELRSIDTEENRKSIKQVVLRHSEELDEITDHVSSSDEYASVFLDHVSGYQDMVLKEILGLDKLPEQRSWGMAERGDYAQCGIQCKERLKRLLSIKQNVVVVAQEREFENENPSEFILPSVGAGLTPSLAGWLNTAVEYICRTFIRQQEVTQERVIKKPGKKPRTVTTKIKGKGVEFCLQCSPHPVFMTKFRMPRGKELPDVIVDPDFDKVMALIRG